MVCLNIWSSGHRVGEVPEQVACWCWSRGALTPRTNSTDVQLKRVQQPGLQCLEKVAFGLKDHPSRREPNSRLLDVQDEGLDKNTTAPHWMGTYREFPPKTHTH